MIGIKNKWSIEYGLNIKEMVRHIESLEEYESLIDTEDKLIVLFFTGSFCGPCKTIYPYFDTWIPKYQDKAIFVKVDVSEAEDIADLHNIKGVPTFIFIHKRKIFNNYKIVGANPIKIINNLETILSLVN